MSLKKELDVADSSWVPLRAAVFECFRKDAFEGGVKRVLLTFKSRFAPKIVEINPARQTLKYVFADESIFESAPWDFLSNEQKLPPNAFAAALLYKSVGEIWDMMKDNFNRKVSAGVVSLFARIDDFRAPFATIPSDHWSLFRVTDWETGTAAARDGRCIFSVHAKIAAEKVNIPGRKPLYDPDQINGEVRRAIRTKGFPEPGGEISWQSRADVERLIGGFCLRTTGKEPARSTLQNLAKKALAAAKSTGDR